MKDKNTLSVVSLDLLDEVEIIQPLNITSELYECWRCKNSYDESDVFFKDRVISGNTYAYVVCRKCVKALRKIQVDKNIKNNANKLDKEFYGSSYKYCGSCHRTLPRTELNFMVGRYNADGLVRRCRLCSNFAGLRQELAKHNPGVEINISFAQYAEWYENQRKKCKDKCIICERKLNFNIIHNSGKYSAPCVDHKHKSNIIDLSILRGIICNSCNTLLGYAYDSIDILKNAIKYLDGVYDTDK